MSENFFITKQRIEQFINDYVVKIEPSWFLPQSDFAVVSPFFFYHKKLYFLFLHEMYVATADSKIIDFIDTIDQFNFPLTKEKFFVKNNFAHSQCQVCDTKIYDSILHTCPICDAVINESLSDKYIREVRA